MRKTILIRCGPGMVQWCHRTGPLFFRKNILISTPKSKPTGLLQLYEGIRHILHCTVDKTSVRGCHTPRFLLFFHTFTVMKKIAPPLHIYLFSSQTFPTSLKHSPHLYNLTKMSLVANECIESSTKLMGSLGGFKARLGTKRFHQLQGLNISQTFSPVAKPTTPFTSFYH